MSGPRPTLSPPITNTSDPYTLSDAASGIVYHIPQLLRRLRDLENEEAELDAKARQLVERLPDTKNQAGAPSTPSRSFASTPVSKRRGRAAADRGDPRTPPHIDPRNIETPVKKFLLMESFGLAMSIKSKRKGRIFMTGDSSEFGERR